MSFFDDVDEPPAQAPRTRSRAQRPPSGRPPSGADQSIRNRRIIAAAVVVVVIVLMAVGIHSCQASQAENALKDYNAQVNSLISASDTTGSQLLTILGQAAGKSPTEVYTQVSDALNSANHQLTRRRDGASRARCNQRIPSSSSLSRCGVTESI